MHLSKMRGGGVAAMYQQRGYIQTSRCRQIALNE
jgi:hypothetical protein